MRFLVLILLFSVVALVLSHNLHYPRDVSDLHQCRSPIAIEDTYAFQKDLFSYKLKQNAKSIFNYIKSKFTKVDYNYDKDIKTQPNHIGGYENVYEHEMEPDKNSLYECNGCNTPLFIHLNSYDFSPTYRYFFHGTEKMKILPKENESDLETKVTCGNCEKEVGVAFKRNKWMKEHQFRIRKDSVTCAHEFGYNHTEAKRIIEKNESFNPKFIGARKHDEAKQLNE